MKRFDSIHVYLGTCLIASAAVIPFFAVCAPARAGSVVEVDARSSAPTSTAGTPRAAEQSSGGPSAAGATAIVPAATPIIPNLGNAGLVADFDGSQRSMPYELYSAIVASFPQSRVAEAIAVAKCETGSTFDNKRIGRAGERSVFQVHPVWFKKYDANRLVNDVTYAARVAAEISKGGSDWSPWSCKA